MRHRIQSSVCIWRISRLANRNAVCHNLICGSLSPQGHVSYAWRIRTRQNVSLGWLTNCADVTVAAAYCTTELWLKQLKHVAPEQRISNQRETQSFPLIHNTNTCLVPHPHISRPRITHRTTARCKLAQLCCAKGQTLMQNVDMSNQPV
jgi:hypothetical protein